MKKLIFIILFCPSLLLSQWIQQTVPSDIDLLRTIDFINSNTGVSAGWVGTYNSYGKVIYTTNSGINWYNAQIPDSSQGFMKVQLVTSNIGYMAGTYTPTIKKADYKIQRSNEKGITASNPKQLRQYFEYIDMTESQEDYKGLFLKTTNGGQSWFTLNNLPSNVYFLNGMCFLNENTGFVTASLNYYGSVKYDILKTTNGGLNWNTITTVDSIDIDNIFTPDGNVIIAVGRKIQGGPSNVKGLLLKSNNGGQSWTIQYFQNVYSFWDVHFTNSTTGFVAGGDGINQAVIYRTTNAGLNWSNIYSLAPMCVYYGVKFVNGTGKGFAVGGQVVQQNNNNLLISRTSDYGDTWTNHFIQAGTNIALIGTSIATDNIWFTCGGAVSGLIYKTTTGGVGIEPISNNIPEKLSLYQNYPNPFNPNTNIRFDITRSLHVKLIIYDALGREVATLVNEKLSAGNYEVDWMGSDYPSGVYFYRLEADDYKNVKKMLLVK